MGGNDSPCPFMPDFYHRKYSSMPSDSTVPAQPPRLSLRGQAAQAGGAQLGFMWNILNNQWHPETNANGYVSVGVAENSLLHDMLLDYIHAHLSLPSKYLTYNEGSAGSSELRGAVCHFLNRHLDPVRFLQPSHVVMTNGSSSAIEQLSWAFTEPGEGVLLGRPYYGTFITDISLRPQAVVVPVEFGDLDPLSLEAVAQYEKALVEYEGRTGKRIRAVVLCHPHNPLGRCYPKPVLIELMKFCQRRQIHLVSDEIYALSTWENRVDNTSPTPYVSILSIDPTNIIDPDLIHLIWGMSKDFGANGLRVGAIISQNSKDIQNTLQATSLYSFVSGLSDRITALILRDDTFTDKYIQLNSEKLSAAHEYVARFLQKHQIEYRGGCNAGFFIWVNLGKKYLEANPAHRQDIDLTETVMKRLLDNKVFLASGQGFGSEVPGWFRIVFANSELYLEAAMNRILAAVQPDGGSSSDMHKSIGGLSLNGD